MKCKKCKTEIPVKSKVCPNCNAKVKNQGCLIAFLIVFIIIVATIAIVAVVGSDNTTPPNDTDKTNGETTQQQSKVIYNDDNYKISFVKFEDPKLGTTVFNLALKIENKSKTNTIVALTNGYADDSGVFLGSGMPIKVNAGKNLTGVFTVGYGNSGITDIDSINKLSFNINFFDENMKELYTTKTVEFNVK